MTRALIFGLLTLLALPAIAAGLPAKLDSGGQTLSLNGSGERTKLMIGLYKAGLYLTEASADAGSILSADGPMTIRLEITSGLITAEKMEKATRKGFKKSTGGNIEPLANEIETFMNVFRQGIAKGDTYDLSYVPDQGTTVYKNGESQSNIQGLPFKQALFGIWLGKDPVQKSLKSGLLGN